jgi:hypothetical protein
MNWKFWKKPVQKTCAALNHHPRTYDGSWMFGYGYYCNRCHQPADPWDDAKTKAVVEALGSTPDQVDVARACGGGPR